VSYDVALFQWEDADRRLSEAAPEVRPALERVSERILAELRRRLGSRFTTAELAELYSRGTDWCLEVAVRAAPDRAGAWDVQTAADAAFARYVREAVDFAGGRRLG
jgi:hypothetical protein